MENEDKRTIFNYKLFINLLYSEKRKPSKSGRVENRALVPISQNKQNRTEDWIPLSGQIL